MRIVVGLAALVLLAGCVSKVDVSGAAWMKSGAGVQQVTLDQIDCARLAGAIELTPDLILGGLFDVGRLAVDNVRDRNAYDRCMTDRGYRPPKA